MRQGDPISALLFSIVMEDISLTLKQKWKHLDSKRVGKHYSIVVDNSQDSLTNLRFADDVLLLATCRGDVRKMINDLIEAAGTYGLKLHLGKTVVLTNCTANRPENAYSGPHRRRAARGAISGADRLESAPPKRGDPGRGGCKR